MVDISANCTYTSWSDGPIRNIWIETPATADAADTIALDMSDYGGKTLEAIDGWKHTTTDSVVIVERMTTSVSGTTLTLTIPAGTDNDKRVAKVMMSST